MCTTSLLIIESLMLHILSISIDTWWKTWYKIMLGIIKKIFIALLSSIVNASNHTKCVSLSNQKCMIQPTLINLHLNEYSQEFHYYPFAVKLDGCFWSCNILDDLSHKVCVPNKTGDLNLIVFNIITGIKESETLTKHISYKYKCIFDKNVIHINRGITINVDVNVNNVMFVKKIMFGILLHCKYYGWFSDYVWWNYRFIQRRRDS